MNSLKSPLSRSTFSLSFGGIALLLGACQKDATPTSITPTAVAVVAPTVASTGAPERTKPAPLADGDIAKAIDRHFQDEALLRSEHVRTTVSQGIASLTGTVGNLLAKERAVSVTETIKGVRSIVDQVTVTPVTRTDAQLKADVISALHDDPATRPHAIAVEAKDGKVTLSGTADSWQQKTLFADVAKMVPGVKDLDNAMVLHYAITRPESEILADVKHRIANDVWLDGDALAVTVSGHTVHVGGLVSSLAQKSRARRDGWVAGVVDVNDDAVSVDWFAQLDQRRITDYPLKSDAEIGQAVRDAVALDARLKTLVPKIEVQSGLVVLTGLVDSPKARAAAAADAKDTVGVWNVRDQMLVQPLTKATDAEIEATIKRMLTRDLLLSDGKSIQVTSTKGKVALKGSIASGFERFDAIAVVGSVPGVTEIDDGLIVKRPAAEIKAEIEDRLFWDARVQRDRVSVAVAPDGVATLTGTLDSWSEIKTSADDALWGGATRVTNLLKLRNHPEVVAH